MSTDGIRVSAIEDGAREAIEIVALFDEAILEVRHLVDPRTEGFTVGSEPGAALHAALGGRHALVRPTGDGWLLSLPALASGEVTLDGRAEAIAGLRSVPLGPGVSARVDLGAVTIHVRHVAAPLRHPVPLRADRDVVWSLGATFSAGAIALAIVFSVPPDAKTLAIDPMANLRRSGRILLKPPEEPPLVVEKAKSVLAGGGDRGKRHKGPQGKTGSPSAARSARGAFRLAGPKDNPDPHLAREQAIAQARQAGLLGIVRSVEGSTMSSIFGHDSAIGRDAESALGVLVGTQVGDGYGCAGCLGIVGTGRGGGGPGEGTIGVGPWGRGIGPGGGGSGPGGPYAALPKLREKKVTVPDPPPVVKVQGCGGLDKETIRRVVRRHLNEVRFCYEKELARQPDLFGRVSVQFTIGTLGQVLTAAVQQSTVGNPPVEQCIVGAVKRWEFPRPECGMVQVGYPFMLRGPTGE